MQASEKVERRSRTRMQWASAILVNTTLFIYGLQSGWVSPMAKILQSNESPIAEPLTDFDISLIAGVPTLTAIVGSPLVRYIADRYGRKQALNLIAISHLIGWITKICTSNIWNLIIARSFFGIGAAGCFQIVPIYVKEISQDNIRGALGSIMILSQNLGVLLIYGIGGYCSYYTVLYIVTGISVASMVTLFLIPESPSFLVNQGEICEAATAVAFLRSLNVENKEVQTEIEVIKKEDDYYKSIPEISYFSILKNKAWRHGFIIVALIATIRAVNGSFAIISYASTLLQNSGIGISPDLQSLTIPVVLILGTAISMTFVDKVGRKILLGTAFFTTMVSFAALAIDVMLRDRGFTSCTWLPILAILVIMASYGVGVSPLLFIIMTEMFNFQIRGKLTASLCMLAWGVTFVQLLMFTSITNVFGADIAFLTFGAINLLGVLIVIVLLPETNGKGVKEIEAILEKLSKNV